MSDMKCPFCQQEMRRTNGTHNKVGVWQCQNSNDPDNVCIASGYLFNDDVLNYITRTRKENEDKQAVLNCVVDMLKTLNQKYTLIMGKDVIKETVRLLEQKKPASVHNKIEFPEYNDGLLEEFDKQFFENGQDDDLTEAALEQKEVK